jgi:CDP-diacylglycerol---serine O-phosphatidyltransferase
VRHFSMIRGFHLADLFTFGNLACGMGAVFAAMSHVETQRSAALLRAVALVVAAWVCDMLDGPIARMQKTHSAMGRELDSLADAISFGVAPAGIAYAAGFRSGWDQASLTFFVACGISRLARFNVTSDDLSFGGNKVKYCEGIPIPTSVGLVVVLGHAIWSGWMDELLSVGHVQLWPSAVHAPVLVFAVLGALMISKTIHLPKP